MSWQNKLWTPPSATRRKATLDTGYFAIPLPPPPIGIYIDNGDGNNGYTDPDRPRLPIGLPSPDLWPRSSDQEPCWRYEYSDCNGELVYIGIINNLDRRAKEHIYDGVVEKYTRVQCPITKTYTEEAPNRATCGFREKLFIIWNRPLFNTVYNSTPLPYLLIAWSVEINS